MSFSYLARKSNSSFGLFTKVGSLLMLRTIVAWRLKQTQAQAIFALCMVAAHMQIYAGSGPGLLLTVF